MSHLFMFYGPNCSACDRMLPLINQLLHEEGVEIDLRDIYEDEANYRLMENYDNGHCEGIPFFINTKTNQWLCGAVAYNELLTWAQEI